MTGRPPLNPAERPSGLFSPPLLASLRIGSLVLGYVATGVLSDPWWVGLTIITVLALSAITVTTEELAYTLPTPKEQQR